MVNNSTNIIKTNSDLSPKTIEHKKALTYGIGSPGPELGQEQKRGSVKPDNGIPNLPSW